jgi:SAM-dependent methyltransferase
MAAADTVNGTAAAQGELWGTRARDWAELQEPAHGELYPAVLDAAGVGEGTRHLDVGCGSGYAVKVASERGAHVTGFDASAGMIDLARERVPGVEFTVGEIEALPYDDSSFDVVTGFNSFQHAADPVHALTEARRVACDGGTIAIVTWGLPEQCEAAPYVKILGSFLPPPPPGAPGPFALSTPGALEDLAAKAGLEPVTAGDVLTTWRYPDEATAVRALLSAGPAVRAIGAAGEDEVAAAVRAWLAAFRTADGGYAIENTWRYLIAKA